MLESDAIHISARNAIVQTLRETCSHHPSIHAAWLEGAGALNRVDACSDIDFWLDVEDGFEDDAIATVKTSLQILHPTFAMCSCKNFVRVFPVNYPQFSRVLSEEARTLSRASAISSLSALRLPCAGQIFCVSSNLQRISFFNTKLRVYLGE